MLSTRINIANEVECSTTFIALAHNRAVETNASRAKDAISTNNGSLGAKRESGL